MTEAPDTAPTQELDAEQENGPPVLARFAGLPAISDPGEGHAVCPHRLHAGDQGLFGIVGERLYRGSFVLSQSAR